MKLCLTFYVQVASIIKEMCDLMSEKNQVYFTYHFMEQIFVRSIGSKQQVTLIELDPTIIKPLFEH